MQLSKRLEKFKKEVNTPPVEGEIKDADRESWKSFWRIAIAGYEQDHEFIVFNIDDPKERYDVTVLDYETIKADVDGKETNFKIFYPEEGKVSFIYKMSRKEKYFTLAPKVEKSDLQ